MGTKWNVYITRTRELIGQAVAVSALDAIEQVLSRANVPAGVEVYAVSEDGRSHS